jgi:hypothetical protein
MTYGTFTGLISRALSQGKMRAGPPDVTCKGHKFTFGKELDSKVLVETDGGFALQPGDATYFDTVNGADNILEGGGDSGGGDFSAGGGMNELNEVTTAWLVKKHPDLVTRVRDSLTPVVPQSEANSADITKITDVFKFMCDNFYDQQLRMKNLSSAQQKEVIAAGTLLMKAVFDDAADLQSFILGNSDSDALGFTVKDGSLTEESFVFIQKDGTGTTATTTPHPITDLKTPLKLKDGSTKLPSAVAVGDTLELADGEEVRVDQIKHIAAGLPNWAPRASGF